MTKEYRKQLEERIDYLTESLYDEDLRHEYKQRNQVIKWNLLDQLQTMNNPDLDKN